MKERQWSEELMVHEVEIVRPPTVPGGKEERYKLFKGCGVSLSLPHT